MDIAIEILKWVLLILLAGFIGQFGKSLSLRIIHYIQDRNKKGIANTTVAAQEPNRPVKVTSDEADQKVEKKMLKNQLKLDKKREKLKSKGEDEN